MNAITLYHRGYCIRDTWRGAQIISLRPEHPLGNVVFPHAKRAVEAVDRMLDGIDPWLAMGYPVASAYPNERAAIEQIATSPDISEDIKRGVIIKLRARIAR